MDDKKLAGIRKRCNAATPGPWTIRNKQLIESGRKGIAIGIIATPWNGDKEERTSTLECAANVRFISHAREDVPELLEEIDWLHRCLYYLAQKLVHDDGSGNSGLTSGKWKGAEYGECYTLYQTREAAIQSWIDEAEREVSRCD